MLTSVLLSKKDSVAILTLNRPENLNAINDDLGVTLKKALHEVASDPAVKVVVIRGGGSCFSAGGDLGEFASNPGNVLGMAERFQDAMRQLAEVKKPVIASLQGAVAGGGLAIALACDLAIAAENSRLVFAYSKLGVTCDGGLSYRLPRLVGIRKSIEIALIDNPIDAAEALRLGLVNRVVPSDTLDTETARLAERLTKLDPFAVAATKALFAESWGSSLDEQLNAEISSFAACSARPEFIQRIATVRAHS